jgi:DNA-binding NarL/FixJ family response regulator
MADVLIVSPLATVRAGLAAVLASSGDLRVVGEAATLDADAVADLTPDVDVVLLDAPSLADVEEAAGSLDGVGPGLVVLGPPGGAARLIVAAPSFAWASLAREAGPARIVAAARAVASGLVAFEPALAVRALAGRGLGPFRAADELEDLTAREREVLTLVATGLTNKAIAQRLAVSEHTVKFHVASILAKLGAESRTEAVHLAARRGLLTL